MNMVCCMLSRMSGRACTGVRHESERTIGILRHGTWRAVEQLPWKSHSCNSDGVMTAAAAESRNRRFRREGPAQWEEGRPSLGVECEIEASARGLQRTGDRGDAGMDC